MKKSNEYDAYAKYRYNYCSKQKNKKGFLFALFFVVFCISVVVFFSISFSNFLLVNKVVNINSSFIQNAKTLYALCLDNATTIEDAHKKSGDQQKQGGAGFIFQTNNGFKVISSIYSTKTDCEKVKSNLISSGVNVEIIQLTLPAINLKVSLNSSSSQILGEGLNLFYKNYQILYNLSVEFDKQNIDLIKVKSSIKNLQDENSKIVQKYSNQFVKSSNVSILYIKIYLNKINTNLDNLLMGDESINLSSSIKQTYCNIINDYLILCNEIS